MKELIARYDAEWKRAAGGDRQDVSTAKSAPAYAYALDTLKILPPVRPSVILNAGGNYVEHTAGIAAQQQRAGAAAGAAVAGGLGAGHLGAQAGRHARQPVPVSEVADRRHRRQRSDRGAARPTNIDFECEFDIVIGKPAKYVPDRQRGDYIFGYTVQIDVSDRGGRGDRKMGGSDWLIGKNHDTFGPLGPFIVPKEFVKDPMNMRHTFTLNGR